MLSRFESRYEFHAMFLDPLLLPDVRCPLRCYGYISSSPVNIVLPFVFAVFFCIHALGVVLVRLLANSVHLMN